MKESTCHDNYMLLRNDRHVQSVGLQIPVNEKFFARTVHVVEHSPAIGTLENDVCVMLRG